MRSPQLSVVLWRHRAMLRVAAGGRMRSQPVLPLYCRACPTRARDGVTLTCVGARGVAVATNFPPCFCVHGGYSASWTMQRLR